MRIPHHYLNQNDPPRDIPMCDIEVVCRPCSQALPNGQVVAKGTHTIRVYEDQVDDVMALIETETVLLEQAKKTHEDRLARFVEQQTMGARGDEEMIRKVVETYPSTPEVVFCEIAGRHVNPLVDAKVVKRDIAPPVSDDPAMAQKKAYEQNQELLQELVPLLRALAVKGDKRKN